MEIHHDTHPDRLAVIARLFGLNPAPAGRCRVLELGCAGGGNLLPMACHLPDSQFVGVDLSIQQINNSRHFAAELGLKNITFKHKDLAEIGPEEGEFDYIIAHGVYSYVPENTRQRLLEICQSRLAPNGLAFISFNILPGWATLSAIRGMLLYHTRDITSPQEKIEQSLALLSFLKDYSVPVLFDRYPPYLNQVADYVKIGTNTLQGQMYWQHEYLEEYNQPYYFHEFLKQIGQTGLQYLADSEVALMTPCEYPEQVAAAFRESIPDPLELEQYLDFLRNRQFRRSLICRQEVALQRLPKASNFNGLLVRSHMVPQNEVIFNSAPQVYNTPAGITLTFNDPLQKAALAELLARWPVTMPFEDLVSSSRARLNRWVPPSPDKIYSPEDDRECIAALLWTVYSRSSDIIELHSWQPPFALNAAVYPLASPAARFQAVHHFPISNLFHQQVFLSPQELELLPFLDGQHHRLDLLSALPTWTPDNLETVLAHLLENALLLRTG
jgi:hypothetical protein